MASQLRHFVGRLRVADSKYAEGTEGLMLIALVLLFGAGYIWRMAPAATGSVFVVNRAMALFYLFFGELALIAFLR